MEFKTSSRIQFQLLLLILYLHLEPTLANPTTITSSGGGAAAPRYIFLSILFGCLTGAAAAAILFFSLRLFLLFSRRAPILRGPVTFSPSLPPKLLASIASRISGQISGQSCSLQIIASGRRYLRVPVDNSLVLAIKLVEIQPPESNSAKRSLQRELESLAKLNHKNLLSLRAYIREGKNLQLVFDYISSGNLEEMIKSMREDFEFNWGLRRRMAVGIAKGLRYLHFECRPRMLHYRLKPSNVLIDEEMEPILTDCGLQRIVTATVSLDCYSPPECLQSCRYTDKSDVFSFGMILTVLLTGRDPTDPFFSTEAGCGSLARWLRHLQQAGEAWEALDKSILGEEMEEDEMLMAVRIALICISDLPADRPSSDELVAMLTQLHSF